jgi:hypothetical protein
MKELKAYLSNQKDIATMMMLNEMKSEETNLVMVKYWLDRAVVVSSLQDELNQVNKQDGKK